MYMHTYTHLGGKELRCTTESAGLGAMPHVLLAEAKVGDLDKAIDVKQEVVELQISTHTHTHTHTQSHNHTHTHTVTIVIPCIRCVCFACVYLKKNLHVNLHTYIHTYVYIHVHACTYRTQNTNKPPPVHYSIAVQVL